MSNPAVLADHLDERLDALIASWRAAVAREGDVPAADRLGHDEFVDHVPQLLDRVAERLRGRPVDASAPARAHGVVRWRQGYDLAEVVRELGHLRATLLAATFAFARDRGFDSQSVESAVAAIDDVFHEVTADSVAEHEQESRRRAERAMIEVEERTRTAEQARAAAAIEQVKLRTVLANLPVGVWVVATDGTILSINPEGERLQGFPADRSIGKHNARRHRDHYRMFRPDGAEYQDDELPVARALRGEVVVREEFVWRRDGGPITVMASAAPIHGQAGIVGAVVVVEDISERKEFEERIRESQRSYRDLYDFAPDMMLSVDAETARIVECNQTLADTLGYPREQIVDRVVFDFYHPDSQRAVREAFERFRATGEVRDRELRVVRGDGTPIDISLKAVAVRDASGRIVRSRAVWRDVTERNRLEAELAGRESQFRAIAEQSPVLIWRSGVDGGCDYFNTAWLEFTGRPLEQQRGDGWAEGVHPDDLDRTLATYRDALARRAAFRMEYRLRRHDGEYRWITDHGAPYFDARGEFAGYLGSCVDITERMEYEALLQRQKEMALESSRHKSHLLSALSHDARTPLHAVVLAAELLESHVVERDDPEVHECLRTIRHSVRNVLDLLGDLLDLTKIDAGATSVDVSRFDPAEVVAECVSSVENQARLKGLSMGVALGPLAGATLETDRSKLKQILGNLLSNAVRYTERGGVRVEGRVDDGSVRLAVVDTGVGIAPSDQPRIFDEFAKLDHPRRPTGEGTGLGLSICRRLAHLLAGEIELASAPGVGSTFTLILPAALLRDGDPAAPAAPRAHVNGSGTAPAAAPAPSGTVLVVEDHAAGRQYLAKILARMGYRPVEAGDGREALEAVAREQPLAVLMDVNMPVMDGIDATRALRANPRTRHLPIFALTGDVSAENQRRMGEAGVDGFLEKPVAVDKLREALGALPSPDGVDGQPAGA